MWSKGYEGKLIIVKVVEINSNKKQDLDLERVNNEWHCGMGICTHLNYHPKGVKSKAAT